MQAVILAGGEGTRMKPFTNTAPKPMVPIDGKPLIDWQLAQLRANGITDVVVYESYLPKVLQEHLGDGSQFGMKIEHRVLSLGRGSAGCIKDALQRLPDEQQDLPILCGDIISDINLAAMIKQHESDRPYLTLAATEHRTPYGRARAAGKRILSFDEKPTDWENTGVYVVWKGAQKRMPDSGNFSTDYIEPLITRGLHVYKYPHEGYWWDVRDMSVVSEIESSTKVIEGKIQLVDENAHTGKSIEAK